MVNADGLWEIDPNDRNKFTFPDELSFHKEPYATVIPYRQSGAFKVHKTEGLANSALSHHRSGAKYKQENGTWVKVWEFKTPTNCETCQAVLNEKTDRRKDYYGYTREWLSSPLFKGSHIFAPFLCRKCYDLEEQEESERRKAREWARQQRLNKKKGI